MGIKTAKACCNLKLYNSQNKIIYINSLIVLEFFKKNLIMMNTLKVGLLNLYKYSLFL